MALNSCGGTRNVREFAARSTGLSTPHSTKRREFRQARRGIDRLSLCGIRSPAPSRDDCNRRLRDCSIRPSAALPRPQANALRPQLCFLPSWAAQTTARLHARMRGERLFVPLASTCRERRQKSALRRGKICSRKLPPQPSLSRTPLTLVSYIQAAFECVQTKSRAG